MKDEMKNPSAGGRCEELKIKNGKVTGMPAYLILPF